MTQATVFIWQSWARRRTGVPNAAATTGQTNAQGGAVERRRNKRKESGADEVPGRLPA